MSEARKDLGRNLLDHITLINARSAVVQNLNCDALYSVGPQVIRTDHHPRRFELERIPGGTRLRQRLVIGPSLSTTWRAMEENPDQAQQILASRREQHRGNMTRTVQGIKRLAAIDV